MFGVVRANECGPRWPRPSTALCRNSHFWQHRPDPSTALRARVGHPFRFRWVGRRPMGNLTALLSGGDVQAGFGPLQSIEGAVDIDGGVAAGQALLGALFRLASAFHIDLGGAL